MLVKFTNSAETRRDDPIYINPNHIVAVYEDPTDGGSLATKIYGGPTGIVWSVQESLEEVMKILDRWQSGLSHRS